MKATVFFIELSTDHLREMTDSGLGWNSELGKSYLRAIETGEFDELSRGMVHKAAVLEAECARTVHWMLRNVGPRSWSDKEDIECFLPTRMVRSMSWGDLILWESGRIDRLERDGSFKSTSLEFLA